MACAKPGFSPGRSSQLKFPLVARMSWRGLLRKGDVYFMRFACLPDTVDPRGPKGK